TVDWDNEAAHALIFAGAFSETAAPSLRVAEPPAAAPEPAPEVAQPSAVGHANAEELATILDTSADGILMFDAQGNIHSCNQSAEALFGYDGAELTQLNLVSLFA